MFESEDNTILLSMFKKFDKRFQSIIASTSSKSESNFSHRMNMSHSSNLSLSTATTPEKSDNPFTFSSILNLTTPTPNENEKRSLKRKLDEKTEDLLQAHAKIICLENNLKSPQPELKAKVVELEKDIEKYKLQYLDEKNKSERLRSQIAILLGKNEQHHDEINNLENKHSEKSKEYEIKLKSEKKKNQLLQEKYDSLSEQLNDLSEAQNKIKVLESQLLLSREKNSDTENQIHNLSKQLKGKNHTILELESQLNDANHKIMVQNNKMAEIEDQACLQVALKEDIERLPELKDKLSYYEEKVADLEKMSCNSFLLQEKLHDLEGHLEREKKKLENYNETLFENEMLKKKLQDWEALFSADETKKTPSSISRRIQDLQKSELLLTENMGSLKSDLHLKESKIASLEKTVAQIRGECDTHQKQITENVILMRKLQKRLLLISKERDSFKRILDSYESDVTANITASSKERLTIMESLLNNYKQALQQSGIDPDKCVNQEEGKIAEEIAALKENLQERDQEIRQLNEKLGINRRIIHAIDNPLDKAFHQNCDEVKKLKEENARLLAKVKQMEATGNADITGNISANISMTDTKEKAASLELKCKRLVDSFNKKSKEYREACYLLTGYRIDSVQQNKFKLSNVYAASPEDYLLFMRDSKKGLLLLETEYSTKILDLVNTYLKDHDSIPAFLSTLTMNLFKQQTYISQ